MKTANDLIRFFTEDAAEYGSPAPIVFADRVTYNAIAAEIFAGEALLPPDGFSLSHDNIELNFRPMDGMEETDKGRFWTARIEHGEAPAP
jgi:hypothetical protein